MLNTFGYTATVLSILGAFIVSSDNPKHRLLAFSLWFSANIIDFIIFGIVLNQHYALIQFAFFFASTNFGIYRSMKAIQGDKNDFYC